MNFLLLFSNSFIQFLLDGEFNITVAKHGVQRLSERKMADNSENKFRLFSLRISLPAKIYIRGNETMKINSNLF